MEECSIQCHNLFPISELDILIFNCSFCWFHVRNEFSWSRLCEHLVRYVRKKQSALDLNNPWFWWIWFPISFLWSTIERESSYTYKYASIYFLLLLLPFTPEQNCYHVAVLIFEPSNLYLSNWHVIHYFIDYIYSAYQCFLRFSFTHVNIEQVIKFNSVMNANISQQRAGHSTSS
jgi:hypothetical protein